MHDEILSLLKLGWTFELGIVAGDSGLCRVVGTKKVGETIHLAKGRAVWPIEALAQAAVEARIVEEGLRS